MPFVYGFLRKARRGWRPGGGGPVDPDYGVDEGERPEVEPPEPDVDPPEGEDGIWGGPIIPERPNLPKPPMPPPGIWPPMRPGEGWRPIDPGWGQGRPPPPAGGIGGRPPERPQPGLPGGGGGEAGQLPVFPPGMVWPPLPPGVQGKFLALMLVAIPGIGMRYRYVVIDADALPPALGKPDNSLPVVPEREPK